jgi:transcriptional antiterminator
MNKMDGLTHAEIAVQLGISEKSVQRTIIKASLSTASNGLQLEHRGGFCCH